MEKKKYIFKEYLNILEQRILDNEEITDEQKIKSIQQINLIKINLLRLKKYEL